MSKNKPKTLYVYDSNLVFTKRIGQNNPAISFFLPSTASKMQVSTSYFVLFDTKEILFMDKHDGQVKRTLSIDNNGFLLNRLSNSMITFNNRLSKVISCDIDEDTAEEFNISIQNPNKHTKLVDCFNERLLFLDESSRCLYF